MEELDGQMELPAVADWAREAQQRNAEREAAEDKEAEEKFLRLVLESIDRLDPATFRRRTRPQRKPPPD